MRLSTFYKNSILRDSSEGRESKKTVKLEKIKGAKQTLSSMDFASKGLYTASNSK